MKLKNTSGRAGQIARKQRDFKSFYNCTRGHVHSYTLSFPFSLFSSSFPAFFFTFRSLPSTLVGLLHRGFFQEISTRSVSARGAIPRQGGEIPAIRTGEHRNNVQTTVTVSFRSLLPPLCDRLLLLLLLILHLTIRLFQKEHPKSSLVRRCS